MFQTPPDAWSGLEIQHHFEAPSDPQVETWMTKSCPWVVNNIKKEEKKLIQLKTTFTCLKWHLNSELNNSGSVLFKSSAYYCLSFLCVNCERFLTKFEMENFAVKFQPKFHRITWTCVGIGCQSSNLDVINTPPHWIPDACFKKAGTKHKKKNI